MTRRLNARLAPFRAFRYRTATRVDTLGGNAGEGRGFAAFDIFGTPLRRSLEMLQ